MIKNEKGSVLVYALVMLALTTVMGITAVNTARIDIQIAGNDMIAKQAFYAANSGVHVAGAKINDDCLNNPPCSQDDYVPLGDRESFRFDVIDTGDVYGGYPVLQVDSYGKAKGNGNAHIRAQFSVDIIPDIFQSPAALYVNRNLEKNGVSGSALGEYSEPLCTADDIWTTPYAIEGQEATDYPANVGGNDRRMTEQEPYPFMSAYHLLSNPKNYTHLIETVENNMYLGNPTRMTDIFFYDGDWNSSNLDGYGILVVSGNMITSGNVSWHGMIFVKGDSIYNGGGTKEVYGAVIVNGNAIINGTVDIRYAYCSIGDDLKDDLTKYRMKWWAQQ
jgi:hypothetical protein